MYKEDYDKGLRPKEIYVFPKTRPKTDKIIQLDLDGNFMKCWDSVTNITKSLKLSKKGISNAYRNNTDDNEFGGYRWMFESDYYSNYPDGRLPKLIKKRNR